MKASIKSTIASLVGNILEWYEYTLYAYFASVISALFFPSEDLSIRMIMTFATFAVGLAARPIGGIIFGYIGDKYSRKKMLTVTMLLMSVPTFCIGMLPTYAQIGIFAPIMLITLRIIQGIALGGEFGASCVYLYESAPEEKRGLFGTLALTGVGTGLVLSSCTIFIIESIFSKEEIFAYAWRIPFFISVIGAIIGLYMRKSLIETTDFTKAKEVNLLTDNPFKIMFKDHKKTLAKLFAIFLTTQISFFVVFIFGKSMMIEFLNFAPDIAGKFNLLTVVSYTLSTIVFGYLSDKINKKYIILFGLVGLAIASYPFIMSLKSANSSFILIMSLIMGAFIGATEGTLNPLVAESFPTQIRATSVAFCWNFTSVAFGSISPIIAMLLIKNTGEINSIAYYLMGVCFVSISGVLFGFMRKGNC
ncbi:Proline/betaine transporter [Candidatus Arcanobacter lacustris]|uniref:Proline/betaine transporter n=1 Tax=Candidatus Arcanibacter lacustris TaxID=1607817 RepID=A0A0F5MPD1_9RICK|nr:Proline/betaine transporter [Candidatus Arcanobacter lacustris]